MNAATLKKLVAELGGTVTIDRVSGVVIRCNRKEVRLTGNALALMSRQQLKERIQRVQPEVTHNTGSGRAGLG